MLEQVIRAIDAYDLLQKTTEVTVALSGGADSTALLYAMRALQNKYGFSLYAAHYNHGLRGAESDADCAFAEALCQKLGVPIFCEKGDVAALAKAQKCSIELAARKARYAFLERVARGKIATAHTADDTLETLLYCLARGTGLKGLCGIPPKRGRIIRPMLFCTRAQVEEYLTEQGSAYCTDSTNLTDDYTRNRIRHHAVPVLKGINGAVAEHVATTCYGLQQDNDFLTLSAQVAFQGLQTGSGLRAAGVAALHPAMRVRVLKMLLEQSGVPAEALHLQRLEQLLPQKSGRLGLPNGFMAQIKGGILQICPAMVQTLPTVELQLQNGPVCACGLHFAVMGRQEYETFQNVNSLLSICALDYAKITGSLFLRSRQSGDQFKLPRRGVTKSLKKLFCEANIPLHKRECIPVLADSQGVLFVQGFGADARVAANAQTDQFLVIYQNKNIED